MCVRLTETQKDLFADMARQDATIRDIARALHVSGIRLARCAFKPGCAVHKLMEDALNPFSQRSQTDFHRWRAQGIRLYDAKARMGLTQNASLDARRVIRGDSVAREDALQHCMPW